MWDGDGGVVETQEINVLGTYIMIPSCESLQASVVVAACTQEIQVVCHGQVVDQAGIHGAVWPHMACTVRERRCRSVVCIPNCVARVVFLSRYINETIKRLDCL